VKKSLEKLHAFESRYKGKILLTLFVTTFFHLVTEKKISIASWHLPKKVNFRPWDRGPLSLKKVVTYLITNQNPNVTHFHMPSRISHKLHVFGWSFDWFT